MIKSSPLPTGVTVPVRDEERKVSNGGVQEGLVSIGLNAWYGRLLAIRNINIHFEPKHVTAIIGPSGCGKSTLIRCFNRLHETVPGARVSGQVLLDGKDIYSPGTDPVQLRRRIGMVFQRPNPFPTMSIFDNVATGIKLNGGMKGSRLAEIVERSLRHAALWDEVKDKLRNTGTDLSGGQQQRLCIARALAVEPEVLLMDEPCSALDPIATMKIEDLIRSLRETYMIVIVTHNMQQAARVSDFTGFMLAAEDRAGELIEFGPTPQMFTNPKDKRTEDYITGRFG
ncbi:MAG: phosphate ABC transporter ATP-binding protein [Chloroflexi bacterium]|nr:phosphate ABC transporter ATP-binding protein [Chloroflexota bacterium]